jgi:hypothetical protein
MGNVREKLLAVQGSLKAPKGQTNSFGGYKYRSCEDIVEAAKPLLAENGLILLMGDEIVQVADRIYVKATCRVVDAESGEEVATTALARESATKRGMDDSQITGTASSYARKYALNGLFAIDDTKDADTNAYHQQTQQPARQQTRPKASSKPTPMQRLTAEIKRLNLTNKEVAEVAERKMNKKTTRDMTEEEIVMLAVNLEAWAIGGE